MTRKNTDNFRRGDCYDIRTCRMLKKKPIHQTNTSDPLVMMLTSTFIVLSARHFGHSMI